VAVVRVAVIRDPLFV